MIPVMNENAAGFVVFEDAESVYVQAQRVHATVKQAISE
jgi:hypothetical protein